MTVRRVRAKVHGRVQGVSFRVYTREEALQRGLVGWVRNQDDGAVMLEAQGEAEAVEGLLGWCKEGPPAARVKSVDVTEIEPISGETSFRIRP